MLTLALAAICGVLVVTALIQLAGYGRGYGWLPADAADEGLRVAEVDQTPLKIPPMSSFAEVENRPLFNEDRKPTPLGDDAPATEGPPPVALNVTLTGVIIVRASGTRPELRIDLEGRNAPDWRSGGLDPGGARAAPGHVQECQRREGRDRIDHHRCTCTCTCTRTGIASRQARSSGGGAAEAGQRGCIGSGQADRGTAATNA
jgi:hypothetical protein